MKNYQNTLLAGVAALALVAGAGFASAQGRSDQGGTQSGSSAQQHAQPGGAMSRGGTQHGSSAQNTQRGGQQGANTAQPGANRNAQEMNRSNAGQQGANAGRPGANRNAQEMNRGNRAAQQGNRTAQGQQGSRERGLQGLQGNAQTQMQRQGNGAAANGGKQVQGSNVRLSEQQRTQIRNTVTNGRNAPRVGHVDFDVRVGTVIPRGKIHVVPVPETLVRIEPRWRGFLYFVYEDEVVIVNPRTMHIVAVVPV
jgi:hypothetical protein